jgi:hypothetical protein
MAEMHDRSYAWLAELPQEISVDTLLVDPRTGLHMISIPDVMRPYFVDAARAVLHFFAVVRKTSRTGEVVKRVALVSDQALYLCTPNGVVKRCILVSDMEELLLDAGFGLGIRSRERYDLAFECVTADHRTELVEILQRLFRFSSGGRAIPVREVPKHQRLEASLTLVPPPGLVMRLLPFLSRQQLVDAIVQKRDAVLHNLPTKRAAGAEGLAAAGHAQLPADLRMSEEQYMRIRLDVAKQLDFEWRQDPALVQLRAQIDAMEKQLRVASDEVNTLKESIDKHRCEDGVGIQAGSFPLAAGNGILPPSGAGVFRPNAEGLFFINVEPVIVNCELEVKKVVLSRDRFYTGHSNGFIHVWDCSPDGSSSAAAASSASTFIGSYNGPHATGQPYRHLRTLRDHTMRITDLEVRGGPGSLSGGGGVGGNDLFSASADGTVRRWDTDSGRCTSILCGHRGPVNSIRREGSRLISGGQDAIINVWDVERGTATSILKGHRSSITAVQFEGDMMVSAEWGWILFWDLRSGKIVRSLRDEQGGIACLDYSQGIAVAGSAGGDITVWDVARGTGDTISGHTDDVLALQLAGKSCVSSGGDGKIRMWDLAAMKSLGVFHDCHPYEATSLHMEGKRFVAGMGGYVKLWMK